MSRAEQRKIDLFFPQGKPWVREFGLRAKKLREVAGLKQAEISAKVGLSGSSTVSQFEAGAAPLIRLSLLLAYIELAELNNISIEWLMLGQGKPDARPAHVREVQERIAARLDGPPAMEPGAMSILDAAREGLFEVTETVEPGFEIIDAEQLPRDWAGEYLPIIGRLAAGAGVDTVESEESPAGIAAQYLRFSGAPKNAFALRVQGASMQTEFFDGDIVIVDTRTVVSSGICAVVIDADGMSDARLKRLRVEKNHAILESLNPEYKPIKIGAEKIRCAYAIWKHLSAIKRSSR